MTSPTTGLRHSALVVLAVGTALGASACSAGQVSQTAGQVASVDGGQGFAGDLAINNLQVTIPDSGEGEGRVSFVASNSGGNPQETVSLDRIEIDGVEVQIGETLPLGKDCSIIAPAAEGSEAGAAPDGLCVERTTATMPVGDLTVAQSVPATVDFSNGAQIETEAGVVSAPTESA